MGIASLFESAAERLIERGEELAREIALLPLEDQVAALNGIRRALHEAGPFADQPVDCVLWVPASAAAPNEYNPNTVAPPQMRLLAESIKASGFTMPVVVYPDRRQGRELTVVDGFHRLRLAREDQAIRGSVRGHLPVSLIRSDRESPEDRREATIQHNVARGRHGVELTSALVAELVQAGWDDQRIARRLGMDRDEVLRMKQITGLAALFAHASFSEAWDEDGEAGELRSMGPDSRPLPQPEGRWEDRTGRRSVLEAGPGLMLARTTKSSSRSGWNWTVYGPPMRKGYAPTKEEAQCAAERLLLPPS